MELFNRQIFPGSVPDHNPFLELAHERDKAKLQRLLTQEKLWLPEFATGQPTTWLRNRLIAGQAASKIAKLFGQKAILFTVRVRSGIKGRLLHPVITSHPKLDDIFLSPESFEFRFSSQAFDRRDGHAHKRHKSWDACAYKLSEIAEATDHAHFPGRINAFLALIQKSAAKLGLPRQSLAQLRKTGACLVFGRANPSAKFLPERTSGGDFHQFFALYVFPSSAGARHPRTEELIPAIELVNWMFDALAISQNEDKEDFEREGLSLLSTLIPYLTNPTTSPSDAIAYFIQETNRILNQHTLGVHHKRNWVRFVAVDAIFDDGFAPRFQVFPHHHQTASGRSAISSFLISHPKRLTIVKLILKTWADAAKIKLGPAFDRLFDGITRDKVRFHEQTGSVCVSEDDDVELWRVLNLDINEDPKTRCTLGFVIERTIENQRNPVPYAIVAFESDIPDAFSWEDAARFKSLLDACSDLFVGLRISNAGYDIKEKIRRAFSDTSTLPPLANLPNGESIPFGRFRFELMRLDKALLDRIVAEKEERIWQGGGLQHDVAESVVLRPLQDMPSAPDTDAHDAPEDQNSWYRRYDGILRRREKWILEHEGTLHQIWKDSGVAGDVYEFLSHVPSNIVWHCYLSAIPRAIADRTSTANSIPQFQVMQQHRGRSALAMFLFSTVGKEEVRQIIKLSDFERIKEEADNYRQFVRYSVPLSARMPTSGRAYEGDGNIENHKEHPPRSRAASGALVSDLIAGTRKETRPLVFLERMIELILGTDDASTAKEREQLQDAIRYQFLNNTSRWQTWPAKDGWANDAIADTVRAIARTHSPTTDSLVSIDNVLRDGGLPYVQDLKAFLELRGQHPITRVLANVKMINKNGAGITSAQSRDLGSIIHGDLNGRNLVWSKDYLKFFIIDFERVRMGFYGADQLRLATSCLSDLAEEAYQRKWSEMVTAHAERDADKRMEETRLILTDIEAGLDYLEAVQTAMASWQDERAFVLPAADGRSISAMTIRCMLDTGMFRNGDRQFWTFAMLLIAAKQFEYALRGIDDSCSGILRVMAVGTTGDVNLYRYFSPEALQTHQFDEVALGKVARAVIAYRVLERLTVGSAPK